MSRRGCIVVLAVAAVAATSWFSMSYRLSPGMMWLAFLMLIPVLASVIGGTLSVVRSRKWIGVIPVVVCVGAVPVGAYAGVAVADFDFWNRRQARYRQIVERIEAGSALFVPGEARLIDLLEDEENLAHSVLAERGAEGDLTVRFGWGLGGPPPSHIAYVYRSDGTWDADAVYADWYRRLDEHWFLCGDS